MVESSHLILLMIKQKSNEIKLPLTCHFYIRLLLQLHFITVSLFTIMSFTRLEPFVVRPSRQIYCPKWNYVNGACSWNHTAISQG